jgi:hypothetical protein
LNPGGGRIPDLPFGGCQARVATDANIVFDGPLPGVCLVPYVDEITIVERAGVDADEGNPDSLDRIDRSDGPGVTTSTPTAITK